VASTVVERAMPGSASGLQQDAPIQVADEEDETILFERNRKRTLAKIDDSYVAISEDHAKFREANFKAAQHGRDTWDSASWYEAPHSWKSYDWKHTDASTGEAPSRGWKVRDDGSARDDATVKWTDPNTLPDYALGEWWAVLTGWHVDTHAKQDLFLLSQHSTHGWRKANSIISKLIKKRTDGSGLANPSAFVHACVLHVRNSMVV
jgi:hypothetical protein